MKGLLYSWASILDFKADHIPKRGLDDQDLNMYVIYFCKRTKGSNSMESLMTSLLYGFNCFLIILSSLFAVLNRNLKKELTDNSEVVALLFSLYGFGIRLPVYIASDPSPEIDYNFVITIASFCLGYMVTIFGSIGLTLYHDLKLKAILKKRFRQIVKTARHLKKNMSVNEIIGNGSRMNFHSSELLGVPRPKSPSKFAIMEQKLSGLHISRDAITAPSSEHNDEAYKLLVTTLKKMESIGCQSRYLYSNYRIPITPWSSWRKVDLVKFEGRNDSNIFLFVTLKNSIAYSIPATGSYHKTQDSNVVILQLPLQQFYLIAEFRIEFSNIDEAQHCMNII
jgi:hypothetical protein